MSISLTAQACLHSEAMRRSAKSYDAIREFTASEMNSINPGEWLIHACVDADPSSEFYELVTSIREEYKNFRPHVYELRYPGAEGPQNQFGDEVFSGFTAENDKGIVFAERKEPRFASEPIFTEIPTPGSYLSERLVKPVRPRRALHSSTYKYAVVTEADLNVQYGRYLRLEVSAETVLENVIDFIKRKIETGLKSMAFVTVGL